MVASYRCACAFYARQAKSTYSVALGFVAILLMALVALCSPPAHAQGVGLPPGWKATPPLMPYPISPNAPMIQPNGAVSPPYTPAEIQGAYGVSSLSSLPNPTGAGAVIAIVDAFGDRDGSLNDLIQSDLQAFSSSYGLPYNSPSSSQPTLVEAFPDGAPTTNDSGWATETAMDVEWVHVMAPAAKILLVVSPDDYTLYDAVAYANQHASVVSMSWGGPEASGETTNDSAYFSTPGVKYLASTGDQGAQSNYPACSTAVTAIGGTSLGIDTNYNWLSETGWSGSGGGASTVESRPSYQSPWVSGSFREVPDVAADADPSTGVRVYVGGGWSPNMWGGTSLAAPLWAGLAGVIDANLLTPMSESTFHNLLYAYGNSSNINTYFHDILTGNNGFSCAAGYDEVTGIGSPKVSVLLPAAIPLPPANLTVEPTSKLTIAWSPSAHALSYNVYRSTTPGGETTTALATGITGTVYTDNTAVSGTTYYYKVAAVGPYGTSLMSNETSTTPSSPATEDSVAYQINPAHSGSITTDNYAFPLSQAWSVNLGGSLTYPVVADGRVFVIEGDSTHTDALYALNATTGATLWGPANVAGTNAGAFLTYDNGNVFVLNGSGGLTAFSAATGTTLWTTQLVGQSFYNAPPTAANGVIYCIGESSGGTFYAVSEATGDVLWTYGTWDGSDGAPAVGPDGVYDAEGGPHVYKFGFDGSLLWHYTSGAAGGGGVAAALYNGQVFGRGTVQDASSNYYNGFILDSSTGALTGYFYPGYPSGFYAIPALDNGRMFTLVNGQVQAQDVASGSILWTSNISSQTIVTAPIVVSGNVYVGSSAGMVYALDPSTGSVLWSANAGAAINGPSTPAPLSGLGAGHDLVVVPAGSTLVAYAPQNAPPTTTPTVAGPLVGLNAYSGPVTVSLNVSDPENDVNGTFYTIDGGSTQGYSNPIAINSGSHTLTFWSTDTAGNVEKAHTLPINIVATVAFVKSDTSTSGNWKGVYGNDGYNVINDTSAPEPNYPAYATVTPTGNTAHTWAASTTNSQALLWAASGSTNRIAACWFASSSQTINVNLTDAKSHQVALYLLDYDNTGRAETVSIADAGTGTVLDTRSASSFSKGVYEVWNITGNVNITITTNGGANNVVSGLFFDSVPLPPTNFTATGGSGQVALSWTASPGASSYNVYRGTTSGGETQLTTGVTGTTYTDTNFASATTYYYYVTAVNAVGESLPSSEQSATLLAPPAPTVTPTPGNAQVGLSWTASNTATSYNVYMGTTTGGETLLTSGVNGTTYTATGLTNGTKYYFEVSAVNSIGEGTKSLEVSATPNNIPPATAQFVKSDTSTEGSWKGVYGGDGWNVVGDTSSNNPTNPTYALMTPSGNTEHTWASTTTNTQALQVSAVGSTNRIAACWFNSTSETIDLNLTDGNTHQVALYLLDYDNTGRGETVTITDANLNNTLDTETASGFALGVYKVWNISGHVKITVTKTAGTNVVISGIFFGTAPAAPTNLTATSVNNQAALSWTGSAGATSYNIYRGTTSGGETLLTSGVTGTSYTDTTVSVGTTYYYYVTAVNPVGESGKSNEPSVLITLVPPPAPTVTPTPGNAQVGLSWTASNTATSYNVYMGTTTGGETLLTSGVNGTTYTATGLTNGTTYYFEVTGVNSAGEGLKSGEVQATPNNIPPPTAQFVKSDTSTEGAWKGVYGGDGYNVINDTSATEPNYPAYAAVTPSGNNAHTWAASTTNTPALQWAATGSTNRIAACWYNSTSQTIDLNLTDGKVHQVALYLLDYDNTGRAETVTITDPNLNTTLDTRSASSFSKGVYEVWNISGHVKITITRTAGANGVMSGIFFGTAPAGPTNLTAASVNNQAALSWTGSAGATSYNVYRGTTPGGETLLTSGVTGTSYTDTTVSVGTKYYYYVTAVNSAGESGQSNEASVTIILASPPAPTGLTPTPGNAQVGLSWTASNTATSYNVYMGTTTGGETLLTSGVNGTTYTATGLTNGTTYYFEVSAVNSAGEGLKSGEVSATPNNIPPATAQFVKSDTSTEGSWKGVYGGDGYNVINDTSATEPNYPAYAAVTPSGNNAHTWAASTTNTQALQWAATGSTNRIAACWYNSTSQTIDLNLTDGKVHQVALYLLDYDNTGRAETVTITDANLNNTLDTETASSFALGVYKVWNISGHVKITITRTAAANGVISGIFFGTAPAAPTNLTATGGSGQVALSWTGSTGATSYNVYRGTTSGGETQLTTGVTGTTYTDTTVTNGTTYFYEVSPVGAAGEGAKSNEATATPILTAPQAPTGLTATLGNAQVVLNWTASATATSYNVYEGTTSGGETLLTSGVTGTTYTATGLTNGTTYYFEVTAVNTTGESGKSNEASAAPVAPTATATFVKADTSTSGSWKGVYGADGYNVINDTSATEPNYPAYATVTPSGNNAHTWSATTTSTQALQWAASGSTNRIAACWYNSTSETIDLNLTDGNAHQVALYFLDWDNGGRAVSVSIADTGTGTVLDTESASNFSKGVYDVWNISGHVTITITRTAGANAVISGLFFK